LSNFALVQRAELIRIDCPEDVVTAAQVMEEIRRGVDKQILPPCDWDWLPVYMLDTPEEVRLFEQIHRRLGQGEAACLALAMSRGSSSFQMIRMHGVGAIGRAFQCQARSASWCGLYKAAHSPWMRATLC
jgi:predicted nucleic acid-binding protein